MEILGSTLTQQLKEKQKMLTIWYATKTCQLSMTLGA